MKIIPAIDIIDGKCVRLSRGDFNTKTIYNDNPVEVAKIFQDSGIQFIHLVDLDGARASKIINYRVLEQIAIRTDLQIDFGGGLKSNEDLKIAFDSGAHQVTGGSIAVKNPKVFENWMALYGSEKIILGADCINQKIAISGWQEVTDIDVSTFIMNYLSKGIKHVICTDVSKDGMLCGPSYDLYKHILTNSDEKMKLIASGGISTFEELPRLLDLGCDGVIIGKALYENKISLRQLESFILNQ